MRASVGGIESLDIDPVIPVVNVQDDGKGDQPPGDCVSIDPDGRFCVN
jgi:hypothetical protein